MISEPSVFPNCDHELKQKLTVLSGSANKRRVRVRVYTDLAWQKYES